MNPNRFRTYCRYFKVYFVSVECNFCYTCGNYIQCLAEQTAEHISLILSWGMPDL